MHIQSGSCMAACLGDTATNFFAILFAWLAKRVVLALPFYVSPSLLFLEVSIFDREAPTGFCVAAGVLRPGKDLAQGLTDL